MFDQNLVTSMWWPGIMGVKNLKSQQHTTYGSCKDSFKDFQIGWPLRFLENLVQASQSVSCVPISFARWKQIWQIWHISETLAPSVRNPRPRLATCQFGLFVAWTACQWGNKIYRRARHHFPILNWIDTRFLYGIAFMAH